MTESSRDTWRIDEIEQTLRAYGYVVIYEGPCQLSEVQYRTHECIVRKSAADAKQIYGYGKSRFAALHDAYARAGLSMYK